MNHLACGGHLRNSCRVIFKTTPVNVGIPFVMRKYPPAEYRYRGPPVAMPEELQKLLFTGNIRVEAGFGRHGSIVPCTFM